MFTEFQSELEAFEGDFGLNEVRFDMPNKWSKADVEMYDKIMEDVLKTDKPSMSQLETLE